MFVLNTAFNCDVVRCIARGVNTAHHLRNRSAVRDHAWARFSVYDFEASSAWKQATLSSDHQIHAGNRKQPQASHTTRKVLCRDTQRASPSRGHHPGRRSAACQRTRENPTTVTRPVLSVTAVAFAYSRPFVLRILKSDFKEKHCNPLSRHQGGNSELANVQPMHTKEAIRAQGTGS